MTDKQTDMGAGGLDPDVVNGLKDLPEEFRDFPRIYQEEIRPALLAREGDRQDAVSKARKARYVGIAVAVLGVVIGLAVIRQPFVAFISVIVGVGYLYWGGRDVRKVGREAKDLIVLPVAQHLGLNFIAVPGAVDTIYKHHDVGIVPSWDRASYEDHLTGQRHGVDFELFEAHLEERRTSTDSKGRTKTTWVTVFQGQCLRFDFPKKFYGRTLVTRDAGIFNRFGGGNGLRRASLEDPRFEKIFEVYTTDQVESRFLLTPDLMQKLVDLEEAFHGGRLKCAFNEGQMYITLEGGNLFEPGSMFKPFDSVDRVKELLNDFAAMFQIIDAVLASRRREAQERGD
ncbi:DUF3137 domain-containing protein [Hyphomonas pacifica]|uniref:Galanin n=1 Tax=Hyphomonas pacifica TaxID=1280941 RepID=A0A062TWK6_9PROT|nr:DUF3137 domain-containing protein [Hyphomonas pacifica]KCZ50412.1 hypothetical protein HY2_14050 [Hyphomonas pacifica]RAN32711.1 hypothetical protein HY3_14535 [Hyphomonas pacifica]